MRKTLNREIPFGKAKAEVSVSAFTEEVRLDGDFTGNHKVIFTSMVKILSAGKVVAENSIADIVTNNIIYAKRYERSGLDINKSYSMVGNNVMTEGRETADAINSSIEEMKRELAKEFGTETKKQIEERKEYEVASEIVAQAQKEGLDKLLSAADLKDWRRSYNDLHNEGGAGYIPVRISREKYEKALTMLSTRGAV